METILNVSRTFLGIQQETIYYYSYTVQKATTMMQWPLAQKTNSKLNEFYIIADNLDFEDSHLKFCLFDFAVWVLPYGNPEY